MNKPYFLIANFMLSLSIHSMQESRQFTEGCLTTHYHDLAVHATLDEIKIELQKPNRGHYPGKAYGINSKTVCTITNNEGETPLHWLVLYRKSPDWQEAYTIFIQHGANPTIYDYTGSTAEELQNIRACFGCKILEHQRRQQLASTTTRYS